MHCVSAQIYSKSHLSENKIEILKLQNKMAKAS